ncbi:deoxyribose-phosphate aldolase [Candidatus Uhrbacteria bacterium]|nr:deoxyribose-phosphate aldolase [Candidatus Uhrbacteria bacterium]
MRRTELAKLIDHTLLKPEATASDVGGLCDEARRFGFAAVCVNPCFVPLCRRLLEGSGVRVCTVIGFPLGANAAETKAFEARQAIRDGADELDTVISIGALKGGRFDLVLEDIAAVVREARADSGRPIAVKAIIEASRLTDGEKVRACNLAVEAGADFVKTSTGFGGGGATVGDVRLMRAAVGDSAGVKASGGIRTGEDALAMLAAGATRLGISRSGSLAILESCPE